jgi:hypothetical protein
MTRALVVRVQMLNSFRWFVNHSQRGASTFGTPCMFCALMFAQKEGTIGARVTHMVETEKSIKFPILQQAFIVEGTEGIKFIF